MKHINFLFYFVLLSSSVIAQEGAKNVVIEENASIEDFGFTDQGIFHILEHIKGLDAKTRYSAWDANFNLVSSITTPDKIEEHNFLLTSPNGSAFVYKNGKNDLFYGGKKEINFEDISLEEFEIYHQFLTDKKFIELGQLIIGKKTKLSWNSFVAFEKVYSDELVIISKNIETGALSLTELQRLEGCTLDDISTKILYSNEDIFIVSYLKENDRQKRTYNVVTYNYSGAIVKNIQLDVAVSDLEKEKFAVVNLENGSFDTYITNNQTGFGNSLGGTDVDTHYFANPNSMGNIKYDVSDNSFYAYAGIMPQSGDSGILIEKYNENGQLVWRKYHVLEDTSFHLINSLNRYLSFDIYPQFIGFSINSTKGKDYCDFYILNKDTGEISLSEKFKKYGFFKKSKNYNELDVEYEIKNDEFGNLGLDRNIIYAALYNKDFKAFLKDLNSKDSYLIMGYLSDGKLNAIISPKKDNPIIFKSFKL